MDKTATEAMSAISSTSLSKAKEVSVPGALWLWLDLTIAVLVLITLRVVNHAYLGELIVSWGTFLALRLVFERHQRPITVFWIAFTLYSVSAWVAAAKFSERFPPFPSLAIIAAGTEMSLEVLLLGFIAMRILTLVVPFESLWRSGIDRVATMAREMSRRRMILACLPLLVIAGIDWYKITTLGLGSVLAGKRRQFAADLLSASNHDVWVLAIAVTLALALHAMASEFRSRSAIIACGVLILYWTPSILVGSRQELVAVGISTAVIVIAGNLFSPGAGRRIKVAIVTLLIAMFLIPFVETGQLSQATIEFVYPQYMLFSAMAFSLPLHMSYVHGAAFMLPSILRPFHVEVIGDQFKELNITKVGIGDSPVGEAYIDSPTYAVFFAVMATLAVVILVALFSQLSPAFLAVGIGQLAVWGRSDFWVSVFYIVYGGALLWLLLPPPSRSELSSPP
jgi:hypothetical protein